MTTLATGPFCGVPHMGVMYVNSEAHKLGYRMGDAAWANLGQGQPEVGPIPGAPPRIATIEMAIEDHAYGPVEGILPLREAVAAHYNRLYRKGKASQYTAENVAIAPGGRAALLRCGVAIGPVRLGYFTPDYTAYEDLLTTFDRIEPVCFALQPSDGFQMDSKTVFARAAAEQVDAILLSNPNNPTGVLRQGDELADWVERARHARITLLFDEFYSHYNFSSPSADRPVSAAEFVEDVNDEQVVIVDGMTKCFRYPGLRVSWVVGPKHVIQSVTAAGGFTDGGTSRASQIAATSVLEPARADQETAALRAHFAGKRQLVIDGLKAIGVQFAAEPAGTFYAFGSVAALPASLHTGKKFMRAAFEHKVLTVPGTFFDVNPHRARTEPSSTESFVRFSYGPPVETVIAGLSRLAKMVKEHSS